MAKPRIVKIVPTVLESTREDPFERIYREPAHAGELYGENSEGCFSLMNGRFIPKDKPKPFGLDYETYPGCFRDEDN